MKSKQEWEKDRMRKIMVLKRISGSAIYLTCRKTFRNLLAKILLTDVGVRSHVDLESAVQRLLRTKTIQAKLETLISLLESDGSAVPWQDSGEEAFRIVRDAEDAVEKAIKLLELK